jgi:hypothetical protein
MCECSNMKEFLRGNNLTPPFKNMAEISINSKNWCHLKKCTDFDQHWQVDEWDKYSETLCIKINDPDNWSNFDDKPYKIKYLIQKHGGLSEEKCVWIDCKNKALKNLAFCPECVISRK